MADSLLKESHHDALHSLGMFVLSWSVLESYLEVGIAKQLALNSRDGAIVTASLQFKGRVSLLKGLLSRDSDRYAAPIATLNLLMNRADRNDLLHGVLSIAPAGLVFTRRKSDGTLKISKKGHTARSLRKTATEIASVTRSLAHALNITDDEFKRYWADDEHEVKVVDHDDA